MDGLGALTLIGGITCLLLALQWGGQKAPWDSGRIIGLFVGSGVLTTSFGFLHWRLGEHATIPLRILRQRSVSMGSIFIAFLDMTVYTYVYYMPFYFQGVLGADALTSGVYFLALVIPQIFATVGKYGKHVLFMVAGPVVTAVGTGLITQIDFATPPIESSLFLPVTGLGMGLCMQQPYTAVTLVLEQDDVPIGNAIVSFMQRLGGAIIVPIGATIFLTVLSKEAPMALPSIPLDMLITTGSTRLELLPPNKLVLDAIRALYSKAVTRTLILALATTIAVLPFATMMEWRTPKNLSSETGSNSDIEVFPPI
ncbi:MAG: hypothetical protein Q9192_006619 [Flavoplaca navasiana]